MYTNMDNTDIQFLMDFLEYQACENDGYIPNTAENAAMIRTLPEREFDKLQSMLISMRG